MTQYCTYCKNLEAKWTLGKGVCDDCAEELDDIRLSKVPRMERYLASY